MRVEKTCPLSLALLLAALLTSGCGKLAKQQFPPLILDQADLLDPQTETWLASLHYPQGFAFVIRSVDEVPLALIGARADDLFDETARESAQEEALEERGVFVLVSREPALVQVRVGEELHALTRWGGVIAGPDYIAKQRLATEGDFDGAVKEIVPWLARRLPETTDIPRYRKALLNDVMAEISSELEDFALPSESFYSHFFLKPVLELRVFERTRFGSWWMTYVALGALLLLVKRMMRAGLGATARHVQWAAAVRSSEGTRKGVRIALDVIGILLSIGLGLLFSIPCAASVLLLSGSRLEDQIALRASGVPGIERLGFEPENYRIATGAGIVFLIAILRMAKGFADRAGLAGMALLPEEMQRAAFEKLGEAAPAQAFLLGAVATEGGGGVVSIEEFEKAPYTSAYWAPVLTDLRAAIGWCLLAQLFLPEPLSLAAIYFWIPPVALGVVATFNGFSQATRLTRDGAPPRRWRRMFLGGLALLLLAVSIYLAYPILREAARPRAVPGKSRLTTSSKLTLRGIGPVRIGMTLAEAEQALGGALIRAEVAAGEDCYYVEPRQGPRGVSFMIISGRIARVDVSEPEIATLSGARVGDRESRILSLYPGRIEVIEHAYVESGHYLTFTPRDRADRNYRMVFETDGKVVTSFRAGRLPEVKLVESCL